MGEELKKVSIIMGIYNCEKTLDEAINSIEQQTYKNWELIMCDDGSSDQTYNIAQKYKVKYEDKIILLKNEENKGLNYTLNKCLKNVKGDYIARMDGDDISIKERFKKQVNFLNNNREIDIVSSDMIYFDSEGEWGESNIVEKPTKDTFVQGTPFCHAPCMVRKEAYMSVGGYTEEDRLLRVEDYHLWIKMYTKGYKGMNIKEPLYKMRDDRNAYSRRKYKYRINEAYARYIAFRDLKLNKAKAFYILRPLIVGLIPYGLYMNIRKVIMKKNQK
ncbi:MAG: glycosyltransferase [Sarcina sp.]